MAAPDIAIPQVNGLVGAPHPDSPQPSSSPTKRKRDASDDGSADLDGADESKPIAMHKQEPVDERQLVQIYFDVLKRFDTDPSILKRPLPESSADDEPDTKRQKPDVNHAGSTIADKVLNDDYRVLTDLVLDINKIVGTRVEEMTAAGADEKDAAANEERIVEVLQFKEKANELLRREMSYPTVATDFTKATHAGAMGGPGSNSVLTIFGNAPQAKHLFTGLPKHKGVHDQSHNAARSVRDAPLPNGITYTSIIPAASEKSSRSLTLGELFPAPRNLPPLQPPKAPKSTTKSNVLGFYHPELTEKSKYRSGSYFSQSVSTGQWLDYSNATPSSQIKTKQRERAQSLAGHKPSTSELEMSEMEALFRGAFSSFAPSRDDSAAVISAGQVSRMWWQRFGQRSFQRIVEAEAHEEDVDEVTPPETQLSMTVDETQIQDAIDNWDDSLVDPSLEQIMGKKPDADADVDEILQEVSDLLETLSSYQRNRNLALPTSQNRYSTDPVNGDMLTNGNLAQQPTEEEMATYEALKAQLALIVGSLPPFAVARLNSDKLAELDVSTKIEIRTEEYKGLMEEDEPAAKARAMAAAVTPRPTSHRTPSISGTSAYANQYGRQYPMQSQTPVPVPQNYFPQTPVRPQMQPNYRPMPQGMPPQQQQRPPPGQAYRPAPNGYPNYPQQLAKQQTPYAHGNMAPYQGTPNQQRPQQLPGYGNMAPTGTPNQRFPGYQGYPQQQPQHHPQQPPYSPYANGAGTVSQRNMSPQVAAQHPAYASQSPQPPPPQQLNRTPSYGTPGTPGTPGQPPMQMNAARYPPNYAGPPNPQAAQGGPGPSGFYTVMSDNAQHRMMEQNRARVHAQERSSAFGDKLQQGGGGGGGGGGGSPGAQAGGPPPQGPPPQGPPAYPAVSGLGGIGLGGHVDMAKLAAARANMPGGVGHQSPSPRPPMPPQPAAPSPSPGVNGTPQPPPAASPASLPASSVSPAPSAGFQNPPA